MAFELPPLPFEKDALEPHISKETLEYHHGKHHNAYVTKLNDLIKGTDDEGKSLEEIIQSAKGGLFNQAAQVWNHTFYWNSLSPNGGGEPSGALGEAITKKFGSFDKFKEEFNAKAAGKLRLRLDLAGENLRRRRGHRQHRRRRHPDRPRQRPDAAVHRGRVGARLLHRLPQCPSQVSGIHLEPDQLGLRREKLRVSELFVGAGAARSHKFRSHTPFSTPRKPPSSRNFLCFPAHQATPLCADDGGRVR